MAKSGGRPTVTLALGEREHPPKGNITDPAELLLLAVPRSGSLSDHHQNLITCCQSHIPNPKKLIKMCLQLFDISRSHTDTQTHQQMKKALRETQTPRWVK